MSPNLLEYEQLDWRTLKQKCPIFVEMQAMPHWPISRFRAVRDWLAINAHGEWYIQFNGCGFEVPRDAVLFKLFWYE